jgi:SAM-dependent methyltransferase
MSERWWEYWQRHTEQGEGWLKLAVGHWQFFQNFYGQLFRLVQPGARILDVGCGLGFTDMYLAACGYRLTGLDNDPRIVDAARTVADGMDVKVDFRLGDAFDLSREYDQHDLVFSVGVLEHFDREITVSLLREQAKCAPRVLICIPTRYTKFSDGITDERIYSITGLRQLVREAGLQFETSFGFGDVTVTPAQIWLYRLMPHGFYRWLQHQGYAFNIAAVGSRGAGR